METTRCPQCDALLPHNATVCQLCHADFRSPHTVVKPSAHTLAAVSMESRALPPLWLRAVAILLIASWFVEGVLRFMAGLSTVSDLTQVTHGQSLVGMSFTIFGLVLIVGSTGLLMSQTWAFTAMIVVCWCKAALSLIVAPIFGVENLVQPLILALVALVGVWVLSQLRNYQPLTS